MHAGQEEKESSSQLLASVLCQALHPTLYSIGTYHSHTPLSHFKDKNTEGQNLTLTGSKRQGLTLNLRLYP